MSLIDRLLNRKYKRILSSMSGAFYLPELSYSETDVFPKNYIATQNHIKNNLENFNRISKNYKNNFFIIANMYRYYIYETNIFDNENKIKIKKKKLLFSN